MVGNVALGSEHPIRIQTMTTTDTKDVAATVEQVFLLLHNLIGRWQFAITVSAMKFVLVLY